MAKVTITLVDEHGAVGASVNFIDGFNKFSNAHQVANIVLKHLDELMTKKDESPAEVVGAPV